MKKKYEAPTVRRLTTIEQLIERLSDFPKDRKIVGFEITHVGKDLFPNKIESK